MTARHRLPEHVTPAPARHGKRSVSNVVIGSIAASVGIAGVLAAAAVELTAPDPAPSSAPAAAPLPAAPAGHGQSLSQQGTLIAVTADSLTAQSTDGFVQTYAITPSTTKIGQNGGQTTTFAVNDEVAIVGTVQGDTPVATAVADKDVTGLNGPPMDSVEAQPVSNVTGS